AAIATKPSEAKLRNAIQEKYGLAYGVGAVAERFGALNIRFQDNLVYSALSVGAIGQREETVAVGFFGRVDVADLSFFGKPSPSSTTATSPVMSSEQPVTERPVAEPIPVADSSNPQSIRDALRAIY